MWSRNTTRCIMRITRVLPASFRRMRKAGNEAVAFSTICSSEHRLKAPVVGKFESLPSKKSKIRYCSSNHPPPMKMNPYRRQCKMQLEWGEIDRSRTRNDTVHSPSTLHPDMNRIEAIVAIPLKSKRSATVVFISFQCCRFLGTVTRS